MIKRNRISTSYLDSPLNRSTSKQTHKFPKAERFMPEKKFSPDKFYDISDKLDKNGTSLGYGNKVDIVLKQLSDPTKYFLRSEFDEIARGYRFGVRPQERPQLKKDYSFTKLRTTDYSFQKVSKTYKTPNKSKLVSPCKNERRRTNEKERAEGKERSRSPLNEETNNLKNRRRSPSDQQKNYVKERKSANRLKYEFSQNYLLGNNKTSYAQFLNVKKHPRQHHTKSMFGLEDRGVPAKEEPLSRYPQHPTFGREDRMKQKELLPPAVGPGAYNAFSEFGQNLSYY